MTAHFQEKIFLLKYQCIFGDYDFTLRSRATAPFFGKERSRSGGEGV